MGMQVGKRLMLLHVQPQAPGLDLEDLSCLKSFAVGNEAQKADGIQCVHKVYLLGKRHAALNPCLVKTSLHGLP